MVPQGKSPLLFFNYAMFQDWDLIRKNIQPAWLQGPSPVQGESPHSSSDSYLDEESDEEQERKSISSGQEEMSQAEEKADQQPLQSARESKGSTTCLADIDTTQNRPVKLETLRKTRAAA